VLFRTLHPTTSRKASFSEAAARPPRAESTSVGGQAEGHRALTALPSRHGPTPLARRAGPSDSHLPLPALWPGGSLAVPGLPRGESETRGVATVQGGNLRQLVRPRTRGHPAPAARRSRYVRAGVGGGALTGCAMRAPQEQAIQTYPPSFPPSRSPHRWCSATKATKALRASGMGRGD